MLQQRLWPLRIIDVEPINTGTARLRLRGLGDDGMPYFLKAVSDAPLVPASELLCSGLATAVGLAVPYFNVALMPETDEQVFASRQEGGVEDSARWFTTVLGGQCPANVARQLSGWFAFDLFVNNPDRHINNFLCREVGGVHTIHGFDFSEAFLQEGWPPSPRLRPECNTIVVRRQVSQYAPLERDHAVQTLERLAALPETWMQEALGEVPGPWIDADHRADVVDWWRGERLPRLNAFTEEIQDGAYN